MKVRVSRWGLLALLVPLAVFGWLRAQEGERAASAPVSVASPAEEAAGRDAGDEEQILAPGERLSADNNLSWPVDI